jgi:riboflavin synthase
MFTGIVEELGSVKCMVLQPSGMRLEFWASTVLEDSHIGDSISVSGCCLTMVARGDDWWAAEAVAETLSRTCLGSLEVGERVNFERPVRLLDRMGGHLVQGHVDGMGRIAERTYLSDESTLVRIEARPDVLRYVVEKGSIAADGISLTVVEVTDGWFSVALIPHTLAVTTLGTKEVGAPVNLEVDVIAKYVERLVTR